MSSRFVGLSRHMKRLPRDKSDSDATVEKASFGSRSDAGRYAANVRWAQGTRSAEKPDTSGITGVLDRLESAGFSVQIVNANDDRAVKQVLADADQAFTVSAQLDKGSEARRSVAWGLVEQSLRKSGNKLSHLVLRDANGRIAGIASVRRGSADSGAVARDVLFVETLGTTGLVAGAGSALLGAVVGEARRAGKRFVQLRASDDAIQFYTKLGFRQFRLNNLDQFTNDLELEV